MVLLRTCGLLMVILLAQSAYCKPSDYMEEVDATLNELRKKGTYSEKLTLLIADRFINIPRGRSDKAVKCSKDLLRDTTLLSNTNSEVVNFRRNLTLFVDNYNRTDSLQSIYESLAIFMDTTKHYVELPADKATAESRLIIEQLEKYNCKSVAMKLIREFDSFFVDFNRLFEEGKRKNDLSQAQLDWYAKFVKLNNLKDKMVDIIVFMYL
ncbi:uncharacterized protein LOC111685854 [Lucilia cuprina]|uniref:uncharacterized protein LOC111685854 n=1 Tax=Lucilia cuprina TaxID=7375 RepID=UPI001F05EE06|nr:uncharacterized protein LOC111685854 [Lucilia cuprina]